MSQQRILVMLAVIFMLTVPNFGQALNADLPKMSNLAFGWVSMSGVDPTLDALASFAPTMLGLRDAGYNVGSESADGVFTFSEFKLNSSWESALTAVGPGVLRVVHYGFHSNTAPVVGMALPPGLPPGTPPLLFQTQGDSIELSYAQRVGPASVGLSVVPQDSTFIAMSQGGASAATGKTDTDYGYRLGVMTPLERKHDLRLGANFSYQKDNSSLTTNPLHPLVIAVGAVPQNGSFITHCSTVGLSGKLTSSTSLYGSYQKIYSKGNSLDRSAELIWFGVTQRVTSTFNVRVNYLEHGLNVGFSLRTPVGMLIAAYTDKALTNAKDVLGSGHDLFVGMDIAL